MELEQTKFYEFVKQFCADRNHKFETSHDIFRANDVPFDSVDRLAALYIIENHKELLDIDLQLITTEPDANKMYDGLSEEFKEWFVPASHWAYNNYEREWLSNGVALFYILQVAKKGVDEVLSDCYSSGGWFGSS